MDIDTPSAASQRCAEVLFPVSLDRRGRPKAVMTSYGKKLPHGVACIVEEHFQRRLDELQVTMVLERVIHELQWCIPNDNHNQDAADVGGAVELASQLLTAITQHRK